MTDAGLIDIDLNDMEIAEAQGRATRARKPYREVTKRPETAAEAAANDASREGGLFGDLIVDEKPGLKELYGTIADVHKVRGTNGLKAISAFSGCAGSGTGFAWAGWHELMAIEFVKAARETIAANYPTVIVEPNDVTRFVNEWIKDNSDLIKDGFGNEKFKIEFTRVRNIRKTRHESIINWEATLENASIAFRDSTRDIDNEEFIEEEIDEVAEETYIPEDLDETTTDEDGNPVPLTRTVKTGNKIKTGKVTHLPVYDVKPGDQSILDAVNKLRYDTSIQALRASHDPEKMLLWGDDIRGLDPQAMLDVFGLKRGELDCWEGSPPCKSFSMSGIREGGWGQVLHYSDERDQRTDDLFLEYVRILRVLMPKTFIAENVQGMTVGSAATDVMQPLLEAFDEMGYHVNAKVINSKDYGVPQSRPRVFFIGVRKDLVEKGTGEPAQYQWPRPMLDRYVLQDALDASEGMSPEEEIKFANLDEGPTGHKYEAGKIWRSLAVGQAPENKAFQFMKCHPNLPTPTITATSAFNTPAAGPVHPFECRKFTITEYRFLFGFPSDYKFVGDLGQQGERMGRSVTPYMMKQLAENLAKVIHNSESDGSMIFEETTP